MHGICSYPDKNEETKIVGTDKKLNILARQIEILKGAFNVYDVVTEVEDEEFLDSIEILMEVFLKIKRNYLKMELENLANLDENSLDEECHPPEDEDDFIDDCDMDAEIELLNTKRELLKKQLDMLSSEERLLVDEFDDDSFQDGLSPGIRSTVQRKYTYISRIPPNRTKGDSGVVRVVRSKHTPPIRASSDSGVAKAKSLHLIAPRAIQGMSRQVGYRCRGYKNVTPVPENWSSNLSCFRCRSYKNVTLVPENWSSKTQKAKVSWNKFA